MKKLKKSVQSRTRNAKRIVSASQIVHNVKEYNNNDVTDSSISRIRVRTSCSNSCSIQLWDVVNDGLLLVSLCIWVHVCLFNLVVHVHVPRSLILFISNRLADGNCCTCIGGFLQDILANPVSFSLLVVETCNVMFMVIAHVYFIALNWASRHRHCIEKYTVYGWAFHKLFDLHVKLLLLLFVPRLNRNWWSP